MKRNFDLYIYTLQFTFGILFSFIGHTLLYIPKSTLYTLSNTVFIQTLANHALAGIILAFLGFILLFYLIFFTALFLLYHWYNLKYILRILIILWTILLCVANLYNAISLYNILGYIFIFSITIFSIFLILNYFHSEI